MDIDLVSKPRNGGNSLDPDPITTALFVLAAISAATTVTGLLANVRNARISEASKRRKIRSILARAKLISNNLHTDIDHFERIWAPSIVVVRSDKFTIWDLDEYELSTLRKLLRRITSAFMALGDIQNQIGELELDEIGDNWRMHSIEQSTELLDYLPSIETVDDFAKLRSEIRNRLNGYSSIVQIMLKEMDGDQDTFEN